VDDDRIILESLQKVLEIEAYNVDVAETGQQAIEKLKDQTFNLALLDIKLPDMEGTELIKEIEKICPDVQKIMITGYPTVENTIESLNAGADAYLVKPISPQQVLEVVKKKIEEQQENNSLSLDKVRKWIEKQIDRKPSESITNISEAKNLLYILDSHNRLLQEKNKMLKQSNNDLQNYTYVVSHDLKAPLRTIRSFSTFLLEDYYEKIDEKGQDYLRRIIKAAENMNKLIEELLILSRVGRKFTEVEEVDLCTLLNEIVSDLKPIIEKRNAKVEFKNLPIIYTQKIWIKQLFINLVDNGLKFNKSITPRVNVQCHIEQKYYLFAIQDNGIGIEEKYHKQIFNLFERLHTQEEFEGTGAGLAICKRIVENLGGNIWVESVFGKGSTFYFTILRKSSGKKDGDAQK
jgi:signal transduction histidine kinase